ncbi:MFS transporter [Brevibacterium marinum]|uniref:Oligogalacturonide transporter n=1 Tax=Brevibacterium marinum TaxID=418643 RepID=A0A846S3R0_9MICO|nr:MFS transporter [Brevibacterium marinum]NJC55507.1 oligogalacturonide transporter [Brevibacterium marinum]
MHTDATASKRSERDYSGARVYTARPITIVRSMGYGVVDLMGGGWNTIVGGLMLFFFTNYGGVSALQGASILFIARIVDAVVSVLVGPLTDNFFRTRLGRRFGRRHFFLMIGAPLVLLVFPLLWIAGQGYWYYLVVYLAVEVIMAIILIPWETLPSEMTENYTDRTKLSATRMFFSACGTFLVFALPAAIQATGDPHAYLIAGTALSVLFALGVAIAYFTTWERKITPEYLAQLEAQPRQSLWLTLKTTVIQAGSTFRNRAFVKHLVIYLSSFTAKDVFSSALTFFVVYSIASSETFGLTLQALGIVGLPVTIIAGFLMVARGPRFLYATSYTLITATLLSLGAIYVFQPQSTIVLLIIVGVAYQIGRALLEFTPWNVYPFIPDVDYLMTGEHRAGIYAAVMTFGRKSTGAIGSLIVGGLIDASGFMKPGTSGGVPVDAGCTGECVLVQPAGVSGAIAAVTIFAPLILIIIAFVVSRRFHLDKQAHSVLLAEIGRLEAGGAKADVDLQTRTRLEKLTGQPYEKLWPLEEVKREGAKIEPSE